MYAGVTSLLTIPLAAWRQSGREPASGEETLSGRLACYNLYRAEDGRWLAVGALEPKFWAELCQRLGCEDLIPRQFEEAQEALKARVAAIFETKPAREWFEQLRDSDCCVTLVRTVSEVAAEIPDQNTAQPPKLGEHTHEVLARTGLSAAEIEDLRHHGVIA
jgi:alpha-methylacyl-CoA racemase